MIASCSGGGDFFIVFVTSKVSLRKLFLCHIIVEKYKLVMRSPHTVCQATHGVNILEKLNLNNYVYNVTELFYFTGPNTASCDDFWRMVVQEKVSNIVMLTNLVEKGKVTKRICIGYHKHLCFNCHAKCLFI